MNKVFLLKQRWGFTWFKIFKSNKGRKSALRILTNNLFFVIDTDIVYTIVNCRKTFLSSAKKGLPTPNSQAVVFSLLKHTGSTYFLIRCGSLQSKWKPTENSLTSFKSSFYSSLNNKPGSMGLRAHSFKTGALLPECEETERAEVVTITIPRAVQKNRNSLRFFPPSSIV